MVTASLDQVSGLALWPAGKVLRVEHRGRGLDTFKHRSNRIWSAQYRKFVALKRVVHTSMMVGQHTTECSAMLDACSLLTVTGKVFRGEIMGLKTRNDGHWWRARMKVS
jgi:hypothetical protein